MTSIQHIFYDIQIHIKRASLWESSRKSFTRWKRELRRNITMANSNEAIQVTLSLFRFFNQNISDIPQNLPPSQQDYGGPQQNFNGSGIMGAGPPQYNNQPRHSAGGDVSFGGLIAKHYGSHRHQGPQHDSFNGPQGDFGGGPGDMIMDRDLEGATAIMVSIDLWAREDNREAVSAVLRVVLAGMNIMEAEDLYLDGTKVVVLVEWEAQEVAMVGGNEMICLCGWCAGVWG
jgi:hypothetical protein